MLQGGMLRLRLFKVQTILKFYIKILEPHIFISFLLIPKLMFGILRRERKN